jgi:hypothetical protein
MMSQFTRITYVRPFVFLLGTALRGRWGATHHRSGRIESPISSEMENHT